MLEKQPICKPGTPTQDGSNSSNGTRMKETSTMSKTSESSMLLEVMILKLQMFKFGRRMAQRPNLGNLSTLMMLITTKKKVLTKNVDLKSTDHSISSLRCTWKEL